MPRSGLNSDAAVAQPILTPAHRIRPSSATATSPSAPALPGFPSAAAPAGISTPGDAVDYGQRPDRIELDVQVRGGERGGNSIVERLDCRSASKQGGHFGDRFAIGARGDRGRTGQQAAFALPRPLEIGVQLAAESLGHIEKRAPDSAVMRSAPFERNGSRPSTVASPPLNCP